MLKGFGFVRNVSRLTHEGSQAILKTVNHLINVAGTTIIVE